MIQHKEIMNAKEEYLQKINSLEKLEPDFVMSWLSGLTELEQTITSILYQNNRAMTIKEVSMWLLMNTTSFNLRKLNLFSPSFNFPFKSYKILDSRKLSNVTGDSIIEIVKSVEKNFKFPSFRRIDKTINDLINIGVVFERKGEFENKKIKGLYYLNPVIRTQLNKLRDKK